MFTRDCFWSALLRSALLRSGSQKGRNVGSAPHPTHQELAALFSPSYPYGTAARGGHHTMPAIEILLNGQSRHINPLEGESLLDALRNRCGILSIKDGCQPQGQCGCCLVLMDGRPQLACTIPATRADGKKILTLEGVPEDERKLIADSFVAAAGLQCGFCIPGIALRAKHLTDSNPSPTRDEIAQALETHLCRCTGYVKIVDAVELIARAKRGEAVPEPVSNGGVGARLRRYTGAELTLGNRPYVDDLVRPGMLHGALVLSPHARAKLMSIDTTEANLLAGVVAVATAKDVPGNRWYGLIESDWPGLVAEGEEVRCVGDVVAVVAAEDRATARKAAKLVKVQYEPLPPVVDPVEAIKNGAPQVNPKYSNILSKTTIRRGNVDEALAKSAHVVSGTWKTQRIEHLYLEPESALVEPLGNGRLRLYTQGQGIFDDRRQVASFLGIPESELEVELVPNGGAFGGKEDMAVQSQTALLAWLTKRPVKITLSREESIRIHPKRHPITMEYSAGCDAEGHLTAVRARMIGDTGAYASVGAKVLERAAGHACGPYRVTNVEVESLAVATNNPPCGAMRGFGANQAHFAIDGCMDLLAEKVGIDGWEMRWRNAVEVGDTFSTGQIFEKSVGIKKTLLAVKDRYYAARAAGKAVGIGCGLKNSGIGNGAKEWGKARLVVEDDGIVSLYNGYTEMGQGLLTVLIQFAVEVTGLPASIFRAKVDSTFELGCAQTTGSRATLFGGRAVVIAAGKLKADLDSHGSLDALKGKVYAGDFLIDDTTAPGQPVKKIKTHTAFGFATQLCILDERGELDTFVAAHDVGRAVNPALCEGQIEGSIHMGLGYALTEELPCRDGMPVTFKLRELGVLRARNMPKVEVILVEEHEPEGPFGAKGVGEIGLVPTAAAVAGALHAFDGIRRFELPMRDSAAARATGLGLRSAVKR
jgi:selenium-dependent xanthine dehydrogenase